MYRVRKRCGVGELPTHTMCGLAWAGVLHGAARAGPPRARFVALSGYLARRLVCQRANPTTPDPSRRTEAGSGTRPPGTFHACEPVLLPPSVRSAAKYAGPELPGSIAAFVMKSSVLSPLVLVTLNSRSP